MTRHEVLCEMEERFNEIERKRKASGLTRIEEAERKRLVRWQVENRVLANMQSGCTTFVYLEDIVA